MTFTFWGLFFIFIGALIVPGITLGVILILLDYTVLGIFVLVIGILQSLSNK